MLVFIFHHRLFHEKVREIDERMKHISEGEIVFCSWVSFNPYGAMGVSLTKQKLMYIILTPSIIGLYKFLWTYGSSVHIYM